MITWARQSQPPWRAAKESKSVLRWPTGCLDVSPCEDLWQQFTVFWNKIGKKKTLNYWAIKRMETSHCHIYYYMMIIDEDTLLYILGTTMHLVIQTKAHFSRFNQQIWELYSRWLFISSYWILFLLKNRIKEEKKSHEQSCGVLHLFKDAGLKQQRLHFCHLFLWPHPSPEEFCPRMYISEMRTWKDFLLNAVQRLLTTLQPQSTGSTAKGSNM